MNPNSDVQINRTIEKIPRLLLLQLSGCSHLFLLALQVARWQGDPLNLPFVHLELHSYQKLLLMVTQLVLTSMTYLYLRYPGKSYLRKKLSHRTTSLLWIEYLIASLASGVSVCGLLWLTENSSYEISPLEYFIPWMFAVSFLIYFSIIVSSLFGNRSSINALRNSADHFFHSVSESRQVLPIFIAGYLLTIFSKDITQAVVFVNPGLLGVFIAAAIVISTKIEGSPADIAQRFAGTTATYVIIAFGVLVINVLLISNRVLIEWGSPLWVSCASVDGVIQTCTEALIVPRFKMAALLAAVGTMSTMAISLVPPRRIPS